jgi:hypothetical protein
MAHRSTGLSFRSSYDSKGSKNYERTARFRLRLRSNSDINVTDINSLTFVKMCTHIMTLQTSASWFFKPSHNANWWPVLRVELPTERDLWKLRKFYNAILLQKRVMKTWLPNETYRCNKDLSTTVTFEVVIVFLRTQTWEAEKGLEVKSAPSASRHIKPTGGWTGARVCLDVWWRETSKPGPRTELECQTRRLIRYIISYLQRAKINIQ